MDKLIRYLRNFGTVVHKTNRPFVFINPCCQGSVCLSIVDEIAVQTTDFVITPVDCKAAGLSFSRGKRARKTFKGLKTTVTLLLFNILKIFSETPLTYGRTTKLDVGAALALIAECRCYLKRGKKLCGSNYNSE